MAAEMKPAYLFAGSDNAKLDTAVSRLRARAEREAGQGSLESFPSRGSAGPDSEALLASMPAMSLMAERRYLLADGIEGWRPKAAEEVAAALQTAPQELTIVLVARGKVPGGLAEAVERAGGDVHTFAAPDKRELPGWLVGEARARGLDLIPRAARAFVERVGESTVRLGNELDRLALGSEEGARLDVDDVEALTADTSERAGWTLGDAVVCRDLEAATVAADALMAQGESVTPLTYGMARRLRDAYTAAIALEEGQTPQQVEAALPMAPYPAKMLVRSVRGTTSSELAEAIGVVADLEWWTRGGSDYTDEVALTLAVRRATGAADA